MPPKPLCDSMIFLLQKLSTSGDSSGYSKCQGHCYLVVPSHICHVWIAASTQPFPHRCLSPNMTQLYKKPQLKKSSQLCQKKIQSSVQCTNRMIQSMWTDLTNILHWSPVMPALISWIVNTTKEKNYNTQKMSCIKERAAVHLML